MVKKNKVWVAGERGEGEGRGRGREKRREENANFFSCLFILFRTLMEGIMSTHIKKGHLFYSVYSFKC